jgi:hypothetical protein
MGLFCKKTFARQSLFLDDPAHRIDASRRLSAHLRT